MSKEVYFSLKECSLSFGKTRIFDCVSINIQKNDKIAIIGKNGAGKTTLLNIIAKKNQIDSGKIWDNEKIKKAILTQKNNNNSDFKVGEYLSNYCDLPEEKKYLIETVIRDLKFDKEQTLKNLSGGTVRKLNLAMIILKEPDLILLDEPTNHLDIESILWLENYLVNIFKGAFLVISHNRSFLKNITNKVFWLDRKKIRVSPRGFENFESWSKSLIEQEKRELENKKKFLFEESEWLSKGVTARRKRNIRRKEIYYTEKFNYEKQRGEFLKSISKTKIPVTKQINQGTNLLMNFYNVKKYFDDNSKKKIILENFNFKFTKGQKIGLIGKNSSGKSTILNIMANDEPVDSGSIKIKKNLKINYFDQSGTQLDDNLTIKENLVPGGGDYIEISEKKIHICGYLKNFLFNPSDVEKYVSVLSGGERNRLVLAKILTKPSDILILDEPTNDLDLETIDILINYLNNFKGGVVVASHDMDFLEKTVNKFLFLSGDGKIEILLKKPTLLIEKDKIVVEKVEKKKEVTLFKNKKENIQKSIKRVLIKIEKKEKLIEVLSHEIEQIIKNVTDDIKLKKLSLDLKTYQEDLVNLEKEWYDLEEKSIKEQEINED